VSLVFACFAVNCPPWDGLSVEEALKCASMGYYGIGILAFSQILNVFNQKTPSARHMVAHEFLTARPTKEMFEQIMQTVKQAATEQSERELRKHSNPTTYQENVLSEWRSFMAQLHGIDEGELDNQ